MENTTTITGTFVPEHLEPYTRPSHYSGETWYGWYAVAGMSRDSGTIEKSNFRVMERALRALPDPGYLPPGEANVTINLETAVQVTRCSHWAVGWVDTIYVHGSHEEALRAADAMVGSLESYGLLDEFDHSELECEEAAACWERFSLRDRIDACARFDVSIYAARRADVVPQDPSGELISYLAG